MYERFTDRARRVVVLAQEEARLLNHNYIGTEHILLGLIQEELGVAARALAAMGINLDGVHQQVEEIIGQGESSPSGHIPFTPRAKKVLEISLRQALQLGHNYIGTEHILLGLLREGEGVACQILVKLGSDLTRVRQQVIGLLGAEGRLGVKDESTASGPADSTSWQERIKQLEAELAAKEEEVGSLRQTLTSRDEAVAGAQANVDAMATRLSSALAENDRLQQELDTKNGLLEKSLDVLKELGEVLEEVKALAATAKDAEPKGFAATPVDPTHM